MTSKRRRPHLRALQWSVAALWFGVVVGAGFLEGLIILDADPTGPEFDGLYEADRVARIPVVAVAAVWLLTFVPVLPIATRQRGLRRCRILLAATGLFWIVWVLVRVRKR